MSEKTYNVSKKSNVLYIAVLSFIFLLILSVLILINLALNTQENDARVLNISGRQRMLSQNITKSILIAQTGENNNNLQRLKHLTQSFKWAHEAIQFGNDSLNIPPCRAKHIQDLFKLIETDYNKLVNAAELVINNPNNPEKLQHAMALAIKHEDIFLRTMDTIANSFEKEARDKVNFIEQLEVILAIVALFVVLSIYFFILKPLQQKNHRANLDLQNLNQSLNESLIQLEELTQNLSEEVEERSATEEKLVKNQSELAETNNKLNESFQQLRKLTINLEEEIEVRKISEEKLKKNQEELEKLALIANKTDNAIVICNAEGRVEWVNAGFEKTTEFTINEIIGQKPGDFLQGEETDKETVALISKRLKKGLGVDTEILNYSKSGRKYWLKLEIQPIRNLHGEVINFIAIESDITKMKEDEKELKLAKEKAEKAAMVKQEFLSTMSHEIRTPMNAVVGLSHILLSNEPKPNQVENLKALKFSADTLLALINDILDLSKIEAGKIDFEQTDFSIREIMNSIEKSLGVISKEKGVGILSEIDTAVPSIISGDQIRLNQILTNLVNNAIKFTEKGTVKIKITKPNQTGKTATLRFEVIDTGIGIPKDKLDKIFERFSQAHQNTSRLYGGTGLGLSITKQLVELQGGKIWLESEEGKGTTFYFEIDFNEGEKIKNQTNSIDKGNNFEINIKGLKVLLVEDNPMNHLVAQQFMNKWGVQMEIAENGEEAIEKIINKTYDLVLMDLNMPGIDGFDTSIRIRNMQDDYFKKIPIIALTASAFNEVKKQVYDHGMNDHVSKPFDPAELYNKLTKHAQTLVTSNTN